MSLLLTSTNCLVILKVRICAYRRTQANILDEITNKLVQQTKSQDEIANRLEQQVIENHEKRELEQP